MVKAHCYEWEERFLDLGAWSRERAVKLFHKTEDFYELQKITISRERHEFIIFILNRRLSDSFHDEDESDRAMLIQRSSSARRRQKESTSKFKTPQKRYEPEWWKTFVVLLYLLCCLFLMTVTETIVHDRVPGKENSLYQKLC